VRLSYRVDAPRYPPHARHICQRDPDGGRERLVLRFEAGAHDFGGDLGDRHRRWALAEDAMNMDLMKVVVRGVVF